MELNLAQIAPIVRDITISVALFVALEGGRRGWYVWRWTYERDIAQKDATITRLLAENQKWETRAMRLLNVSEGLAEKVSTP